MDIFPVIMCGGSGTRLWPASRPASPKQFIPLLGDLSTFQRTVQRLAAIEGAAPPIIVAGAVHQDAIARQLEALSMSAELILEPEGRDSAPAMAAAAVWISRTAPDGIAVVVAADHHIPDDDAFCAAIKVAAQAADRGAIVTLGVQPTSPSTAYGYIKPKDGPSGVRPVEAFFEKPNAPSAAAHIRSGCLWNSGNFVVSVRTLCAELDLYAPEVLKVAQSAVENASHPRPGVAVLDEGFRSAPKISIDYAVMEKTRRAAVLPVNFAWTDLGAWDAVLASSAADESSNSVRGTAVLVDTSHCLIRSTPKTVVAAVGLTNIAIIAEPDAVLVCDLSAGQQVKEVVEQLKKRGLPQVDHPQTPCAPAFPDLAEFADRYDHWLKTAALPLWWTNGGDHQLGGFHESLDQRGRPTGLPRRARCQARQVFVYATAGAMGWTGPWCDAADHGLNYFDHRYRLNSGLYRTLVDPDGSPQYDTAYLYDQAFALLAMAALYRARPDRTYLRQAALDLLERIRDVFTHAAGGFREAGAFPYQSNAHMHLLEACLTWAELDDAQVWHEVAEQVVDLALTRFIDGSGGFLREFFSADWAPADGPDGRVVEPGHQFEWAWLLDRWAAYADQPAAAEAARTLFTRGEAGVDPSRNAAVDELDEILAVTRATARLWPQTERLKAALRLSRSAQADERDSYIQSAQSASQGLWAYLDSPTVGLWRDKQWPDGGFLSEPAPASSFYHLIGAVSELAASTTAPPLSVKQVAVGRVAHA